MLHAAEAAQRLLQHPMAGLPGELRQETHTTGILLASHRSGSSGIPVGPG